MRRTLKVTAALIATLGAVAEILSFTMANGSFFVQRARDVYEWMTPGPSPGQSAGHASGQPPGQPPASTGAKPEACAQDNVFVHRICRDKQDGKLGPKS